MLIYDFSKRGTRTLYEFLYHCLKEDILTGEKVQGGEMLKKYDLRIVSVPRA